MSEEGNHKPDPLHGPIQVRFGIPDVGAEAVDGDVLSGPVVLGEANPVGMLDPKRSQGVTLDSPGLLLLGARSRGNQQSQARRVAALPHSALRSR